MSPIKKSGYILMGSLLTVTIALIVGTIIASDNNTDIQQETAIPFPTLPLPHPTLPFLPDDEIIPTLTAAAQDMSYDNVTAVHESSMTVVPALTLAAEEDTNLITSPSESDATLAGRNIVYLVDAAFAQSGDPLAPANLIGAPVQVINSIADLSQTAQTQPIDALIIHASARTEVDPAWVTALARQGTVMVAIDVPMAEYAAWMNAGCLQQQAVANPPRNEQMGGHYTYMRMSVVFSENEIDDTVARNYEVNKPCQQGGEPPQTQGRVYTRSTGASLALNSGEDIAMFRQTLSRLFIARAETARNFSNRYLPPTAVPVNR